MKKLIRKKTASLKYGQQGVVKRRGSSIKSVKKECERHNRSNTPLQASKKRARSSQSKSKSRSQSKHLKSAKPSPMLQRMRSQTSLGSLKTNITKKRYPPTKMAVVKQPASKAKQKSKLKKYALVTSYKVLNLKGKQQSFMGLLKKFDKKVISYKDNEQSKPSDQSFQLFQLKLTRLLILLQKHYKSQFLWHLMENNRQPPQTPQSVPQIKQEQQKLQVEQPITLIDHVYQQFNQEQSQSPQNSSDPPSIDPEQSSLTCNQQIPTITQPPKQPIQDDLQTALKAFEDPIIFIRLVQQFYGHKDVFQSLNNVQNAVIQSFNRRQKYDSLDNIADKKKKSYVYILAALRCRLVLGQRKENAFWKIVNRLSMKNSLNKIEDEADLIKQQYLKEQRLVKQSQELKLRLRKDQISVQNVTQNICNLFDLQFSQYMIYYLNTSYGESVKSKLKKIQGRVDYSPSDKQKSVDDIIHKEGVFVRLQSILSRTSRAEVKEYQSALWRAVYDSFISEADFYRPYFDLNGEPFPWHVSQKGVTFFNVGEQLLDQLLEEVTKKVVQHNSLNCGLMIQDDAMQHRDLEGFVVTGSRFEGVRKLQQERIGMLIKKDLVQQERLWNIRCDEQASVIYNLATDIQQHLLRELARELLLPNNFV